MAWCGVAWCGVVCAVLCCAVLGWGVGLACGVVRCGVALRGVVWCGGVGCVGWGGTASRAARTGACPMPTPPLPLLPRPPPSPIQTGRSCLPARLPQPPKPGSADRAEAFYAALMAGAGGHSDPATRPVFVVGMPRSGSTLVEQILASHSQARAAWRQGKGPAGWAGLGRGLAAWLAVWAGQAVWALGRLVWASGTARTALEGFHACIHAGCERRACASSAGPCHPRTPSPSLCPDSSSLQVWGAGEDTALAPLLPDLLAVLHGGGEVEAARIAAVGRRYLEEMRARVPADKAGATWIVDKMLRNIWWVGGRAGGPVRGAPRAQRRRNTGQVALGGCPPVGGSRVTPSLRPRSALPALLPPTLLPSCFQTPSLHLVGNHPPPLHTHLPGTFPAPSPHLPPQERGLHRHDAPRRLPHPRRAPPRRHRPVVLRAAV